MNPWPSLAASRATTEIALLATLVGCGNPTANPQPSGEASKPAATATEASPSRPASINPGQTIISDGPITVENGQVTYGPPKVNGDVEKQIYKTLSYHRNLANEIEQKVPGGNQGSRQSRQDYERSAKLFMVQYKLSETDLAAILKKGDEQGWK